MTLWESGGLDAPAGWMAAGLVGVAFGFWLERAGFGSSRRLAGIFYFRDFAVVQVMFSALVTGAVGLQVLSALGLADASSIYRMPTELGPQIVGGAIFGVGFVMGGWCPGTALVGLASGKGDALVFLLGAMGGSLVYAAAYPALAPLADVGACGVVTLPQTLGLPDGVVALLVTLMALGAFLAIERFGRRPAADEVRP